MVHFDRDTESESISAYRNHDQDLLLFNDGGSLRWRVGDVEAKCTDQGTDAPINDPQPTTVSAYVYVYTWDN